MQKELFYIKKWHDDIKKKNIVLLKSGFGITSNHLKKKKKREEDLLHLEIGSTSFKVKETTFHSPLPYSLLSISTSRLGSEKIVRM